MCAPTVTMVQIIYRRRGEGTPALRILYKMVSVVVCDMVFVRSGAPRSYPRAPSLALRAIHLAATYGNMRYQMEPAGAVCSHQTRVARHGHPPGDPLLPFRQFTLCRACGDETACVAARYLTLRIVRERHERKNPLPFSFSQRSPVSGLHQIILGKGRKSEGGNHWCLPSCAPAGEAGFSRFASENPNFWNDNENPLKRRTIAPENSAYSFEQTRPNHRTRDSDAKYKMKTEDVPVLGFQTV